MSEESTTSFCLSCNRKDDIYDIYDTYLCEGIEEIYVEMLQLCFGIQISTDCDLNALCKQCVLKLRDAYYFKLRIIKTAKELKQTYIQLERAVENEPVLFDEFGCFNIELELDPESGNLRYVADQDAAGTDVAKSFQETESTQEKQVFTDADGSIDNIMAPSISNSETNCSTEKPKRRRNTATKVPKKINKKNAQNPKEPQDPFTLEPGQTECDICYAKFESRKTLYTHMNTHYGTHACAVCERQFTCAGKLNRHMVTHLEGPFACDTCGQTFSKLNTRNAHVWRVHQTDEPFVCKECGERFKTFHKRLSHLQNTHGKTDKLYQCPYCDKKYFHSGSRAHHIRLTHKRDRKHVCAECPMAFGKKRNLLGHMATAHGIGDMNYQCDICKKRFYRSITLKYHMRTHEKQDLKRYSCAICNVRFSYKAILKNHMKCHERDGLGMELVNDCTTALDSIDMDPEFDLLTKFENDCALLSTDVSYFEI